RALHNAFGPCTPCHRPDSTIYGLGWNGGSVLKRFRTIAIVLTAACAGARSTPTTASSAAQPVSRAESDRAAAARARTDSTRRPYTAADIHFVSGMIGHHAQAIAMSQWAEGHGASATIRTLTGRIINAQRDEINLMQNWLRDRHQPVPE